MAKRFSQFWQLAPLYIREGRRRVLRRLFAGRFNPLRFADPSADRLTVAPTDLRITDPYLAEEIQQRRFPLEGRVLEAGDISPFLHSGLPRGFEETLHGFRWLRHLRAAGTQSALDTASALTGEWIRFWGWRFSGIGWESDVCARRVIAWLSHSPVILKNRDRYFYRRFIKSLTAQIGYLNRIAPVTRDGEKRFRVRIALAMATLCLPTAPVSISAAARQLDAEIDKQLLADGGHASRNPEVAMRLLADLLPLHQTYANLGHPPPKGLVAGIDRMFQTLRFFRHVDGNLALFNGTTAQPADRLLSVLRYDESAGTPPRQTPHMRYQRLFGSDTVIIADTGPVPPADLSERAHAGCLSFELSSGRHRFIVNAGAPACDDGIYTRLARTTAAHSTLVINDTPSATISDSRFLGPIISAGARAVSVERRDDANGSQGFTARHDGYVHAFGLIHERAISLDADGSVVTGRDRVSTASGRPDIAANTETHACIRFHVHPKIAIARSGSGDGAGGIVLIAPDGDSWIFNADDTEAEIEDDVFFADLAGPRRSQQIVIRFSANERTEIAWSLTRAPLRRT